MTKHFKNKSEALDYYVIQTNRNTLVIDIKKFIGKVWDSAERRKPPNCTCEENTCLACDVAEGT